jgi:cytoskeletal protein RodZ
MEKISTGQWVALTIAVVVIILGAWWLFAHRGAKTVGGVNATSTHATSSTTGSTANGGTKPATSSVTASGEAVSLKDQAAGSSVAVSSVTLSQAGWVAIKDNRGWILGAAWFPAGTHSNVKISLLRATTAGSKYQVLLYIDDGDKKFDFHKETLVMNSDGSVTGTMFTAK